MPQLIPQNQIEEKTIAYSLGAKSLAELQGVHPDLVRVVKRAIQITAQDP